MYLERLYSEPAGLFEPVEFRNGMNIIYGKKEAGQPKNSLNSIGKSTLLDLIDFCLGASPQKNHNPRFDAAKKLTDTFTIVLEFSIANSSCKIKRAVDTPNLIEFELNGESNSYTDKDFKTILVNQIFKRSDYKGVFNTTWFRPLISFYLKIQKFKKDRFVDPIKYIRELSEVEINVYQFYLLGFDNTIPDKNFKYYTHQKRLKPTIEEIEKFVREKYSLNDLKETQNEINKLKLEIRKLENTIDKFELGEQYQDAENQANKLTAQIKDFLYQNHIDKDKIKTYQKSYDVKDNISVRRITRIFKELDEDFGKKVNKTLKDALEFRKELSESRKEFLKQEVENLNGFIKERTTKIEEFEKLRAKIFYFLSAKEAITDLTEAFYNLSTKKNNLAELEGNSKILTDLSSEFSEIETEINKLKTESIKFLASLSDEITDFYEYFSDVFNKIYIDEEGTSKFSITENFRKKSLLEISVIMPYMFGKGKNQGRTLIYDLAVLLHSIEKEPTFPKFLVHDGIFDGMDKSHFISTYELVEAYANTGKRIQYITTINEEGTLSEKFGNMDLITPERIEKEAILILSPTKKLFSKNF